MDKSYVKTIIEKVDAEYSRKNFEIMIVEKSMLEIKLTSKTKIFYKLNHIKDIFNVKFLNLILVAQICIFLIFVFYYEKSIKDIEIAESDLIGQLTLETL